MSSLLAKNPIVSKIILFATLTLAFSSGCEFEDESVDLDDEEVATSEMALSGQVNLEMAKESCESRHQVWKNNACLNKCASDYKLYAGKCYHFLQVDQWVKQAAFKEHCEGALHGVYTTGPFGKCSASLPCTDPPGATGGWACVNNSDNKDNPWFEKPDSGAGLEINYCVGLGCGTETNTGNTHDWNPDENCTDPLHCYD